MSVSVKMPLKRAQMIAERFIRLVEPYCQKVSVAGSVRRESAECGDIDICVVPKDEFSMGQCFPENYPGLKVNGTRLKRFVYHDSGVQIELHITNLADWGRILAIVTGSADYSHFKLAMAWNRKGFCGTEDGLRRKSECIHKSNWKLKPEYRSCPTLPPVFDTEEHFFEFLGIQWTPPRERNWSLEYKVH